MKAYPNHPKSSAKIEDALAAKNWWQQRGKKSADFADLKKLRDNLNK